jgi:hypothetical protein
MRALRYLGRGASRAIRDEASISGFWLRSRFQSPYSDSPGLQALNS